MGIEDKYTETVAIVYPVITPDEKEYDLPIDSEIKQHITITILGQIPSLDFSKEDLISTLSLISWEEVEEAAVEGIALFGSDSDCHVLEVLSSAHHANWNQVSRILSNAGIATVDKYSEYRPHITLCHNYAGSIPTPRFLPAGVKV